MVSCSNRQSGKQHGSMTRLEQRSQDFRMPTAAMTRWNGSWIATYLHWSLCHHKLWIGALWWWCSTNLRIHAVTTLIRPNSIGSKCIGLLKHLAMFLQFCRRFKDLLFHCHNDMVSRHIARETSSDSHGLKTGLSLPLCHKALFVFHRPHSRLFVGHSSCYCSSEAKYLVGSLANKTHKTMRCLAVCFGFLAFR